ncbi:Retrovirus-related Pol polyprotein from transposon TNT 1-94 [Sesamum angolense]|uniref:Retrovirus-related Pol polyprotein from transposon TNT 1-94 n=1 Tax=Sesamum angolense TaxID=2727404 RepID=A0AAE1WJA4_9LAMI|nr:Retrovirus-related Pol polyprotein from transposon TNT 1-94 [Sesamum angolense]
MDDKSTFLHGDLEEQIYMEQPDGFTQPGHEHLEFDMKDLGATMKILGMEIHRDRGLRKLWLSQRGYVEKVLDKFGMSKAKPVSTPLPNHVKLSSEQCPKTDREIEDMAKVPYASAVGYLMYAMLCTHPDLAHAVSQICKYMSELVEGPLVVGYVDSDYAGDLNDSKSTTRPHFVELRFTAFFKLLPTCNFLGFHLYLPFFEQLSFRRFLRDASLIFH